MRGRASGPSRIARSVAHSGTPAEISGLSALANRPPIPLESVGRESRASCGGSPGSSPGKLSGTRGCRASAVRVVEDCRGRCPATLRNSRARLCGAALPPEISFRGAAVRSGELRVAGRPLPRGSRALRTTGSMANRTNRRSREVSYRLFCKSRPRSSADRASASGAVCAGSSPAEGAHDDLPSRLLTKGGCGAVSVRSTGTRLGVVTAVILLVT